MGKSDWEYFNCSEDHEVDYVSSLYKNPTAVKEFIEEKCSDGTINNLTHSELYKLLDDNGFKKK